MQQKCTLVELVSLQNLFSLVKFFLVHLLVGSWSFTPPHLDLQGCCTWLVECSGLSDISLSIAFIKYNKDKGSTKVLQPLWLSNHCNFWQFHHSHILNPLHWAVQNWRVTSLWSMVGRVTPGHNLSQVMSLLCSQIIAYCFTCWCYTLYFMYAHDDELLLVAYN